MITLEDWLNLVLLNGILLLVIKIYSTRVNVWHIMSEKRSMNSELKFDEGSLQLQRPFKLLKEKKVVVPHRDIKRAIWLYFWLLLFEGALRKWFLPGLSTPLLIVRDPIALWVVFVAWNRHLIPNNIYILGMTSIGFIGTFTALLVGHGNLPVAIYGARMFLVHFPFIFVMGRVFTRDDVVKMGKVSMWVSMPMAVLMALQFYSPQSAWVNRGLGDDIHGAGFAGALGYFRPPGTFSFTTGNTLYYTLVISYVVYFLFNSKTINRILLIGASIACIAAIPLSISRTLTFQAVLSMGFAFVTILRTPKNLGRGLVAIAVVGALMFGLSSSSFFQTATSVLTQRFTNAGASEGGLEGTFGDRYLGGMISTLAHIDEQPFLGYGLGMGTKVGSQLISGNRRAWLIAEAEWGRVIGELGPLMGLSVILLRISLSLKTLVAGYKKMAAGDMLPWLLLSGGFILIAQGNWSQPTSLGFFTLTAGLVLASLKNTPKPATTKKAIARKR